MGHLLGSSMVGLMATGCVTASCPQSPCPWSRPLLTRTSSGDSNTAQSLGSLGPGVCKILLESSQRLWWVWGLILNAILPLLPSCWGFSFAFECGVSFSGGPQHSPVDGCSAASYTFGVLTEDEHMSLCSAILLHV